MKDNLSKKDLDILKDSFWNVLVVVLYFFIILNRPTLKSYFPDFIDFLLNILPNFLAGIVGTFAIFKYLNRFKHGLTFAILISGTWLTTEEYFPIFSHNLYFDIWDIIMSWFGCGIAAFLITQKQKSKL